MDAIRSHFAEEIELVANLQTDGLAAAFREVKREEFLGHGPWDVLTISAIGQAGYRRTADADVRHVYHNVAIALDPSRQLNNGQPGGNAMWIDTLRLQSGDRVVHIGCGTGYYTAIIASVVGPAGSVTAYEVDESLAGRAAESLARMPHVRVLSATAIGRDLGECDAIYVNAGATHLLPEWLDSLAVGGRLLVPLTFSPSPSGIGSGIAAAVTRTQDGWSARPAGAVSIFPCAGARDDAANQAVATALRSGTWREWARVRREPHEPDASCRLHTTFSCIGV